MPTRAPRLRTAATAVLLTAALGACGSGSDTAGAGASSTPAGDSPSATSSPSGTGSSPASSSESAARAPAAEGRLAGAGYTFSLPDGWEDATAQFKEYSKLIDAGAVNAAQSGQAFSDNVNVLRNDDQAELPVARAEQQFADELRTVASGVRVESPVTVDGADVLHLTGRTRAAEVTALTDQYIGFVDRAYYVVTFSHSAATPTAQREKEVSSVLASWTWR